MCPWSTRRRAVALSSVLVMIVLAACNEAHQATPAASHGPSASGGQAQSAEDPAPGDDREGSPRASGEEAGEESTEGGADDVTVAHPGEVDLLHAGPAATVAVSSVYNGDRALVGRLVDEDLETAWSAAAGEREGSFIEVEVIISMRVTAVALTAGYTKVGAEGDFFTANHRVAHVRITHGGVVVGGGDLDLDDRGLQRFELSPGLRGGTYRIELTRLVPGSHPGWQEACVSELQVLGDPGDARFGPGRPMTRVGPIDAGRRRPRTDADEAVEEASIRATREDAFDSDY